MIGLKGLFKTTFLFHRHVRGSALVRANLIHLDFGRYVLQKLFLDKIKSGFSGPDIWFVCRNIQLARCRPLGRSDMNFQSRWPCFYPSPISESGLSWARSRFLATILLCLQTIIIIMASGHCRGTGSNLTEYSDYKWLSLNNNNQGPNVDSSRNEKYYMAKNLDSWETWQTLLSPPSSCW